MTWALCAVMEDENDAVGAARRDVMGMLESCAALGRTDGAETDGRSEEFGWATQTDDHQCVLGVED